MEWIRVVDNKPKLGAHVIGLFKNNQNEFWVESVRYLESEFEDEEPFWIYEYDQEACDPPIAWIELPDTKKL
jgi:hypothetical protein